MEGKIETIKETIENVENTYKKMVDAYSSTSKGETKELYSDIIDGAKANCEKDVEKNKAEIARLNSDIDAIRNNIAEFTKIIEDLNKDLENYNAELEKYKKSVEYMTKLTENATTDLEDIQENRDIKKKTEPKVVKKSTPKKEKEVVEEPVVKEEIKVEEKPKVTQEEKQEEIIEPVKPKKEEISFEDSLKQIYDLTGYKPKKEEKEPVKEEKTVYSDNLENLFANSHEEIKPEKKTTTFDESDMSEWERILNGADDIFSSLTPNESEPKREEMPIEPVLNEVKKTIDENVTDTINQLLKPYGTTFEDLSKLTSDRITYKDGSSIPFELTTEDIIKAINSVDGTDLKAMKTVGPEITLLRKVKAIKEGR